MTPKILVRGLVLIVSMTLFGFLLKATDFGAAMDTAWVDAQIRGQGGVGMVLFVAVAAAFTGAGLPRQMVGFLAGYAFGFMTGVGLALLGTVLGCIGAFAYSRMMGRKAIVARFPNRIRKIDDFLRGNPFSMTLLIRLLPLGSNLLTNLAAGVSAVGAVPFFAASAIGYIPQTIIFSLAGSGVNLDPSFRLGLSVVLLIVSAFFGVALFRKYRRGRSFDEELSQTL
jgi:uncharacterized membrane protein YdjX (TVP38/TMEM64 family)